MKPLLRSFLFGTSLSDHKILNIAWLLFRLHTGLSIAIHAGFPKMKDLAAPGWFAEQVAGLGFTWPSPAFWAATASWGEFIGGICIALGLLTRFSALQLAFQFFVISFLWYEKPEALTGMYFQQTLFWCYVLVAVAGGGRYSLDRLIANRTKFNFNIPVKKAMAVLLLFAGAGLSSHAQRGPLNGSGNVVTRNYEFKDFDKINIQDLSGTIQVGIGKPFGISVSIDDNLEKLFRISNNEGELQLAFEGNEYNKLYVEKTNISIRISMPEASVIRQRANSNLLISGIVGRYFRLENTGNGDALLKGSIDQLELTCTGNGDVHAEEMKAGELIIRKQGNGDVFINTDKSFSVSASGNGDIINTGQGRADSRSALKGNGDLLYPNQHQAKSSVPAPKRVEVHIKNETGRRIEVKVKYPGNGSYGIDIMPGRTRKEELPVVQRFSIQ